VGGKLLLAALVALGLLTSSRDKQPLLIDKASAQAPAVQCVIPKSRPIPKGAAPNSTYWSSGIPPKRFQGNTKIPVEFATPEEIQRKCGINNRPVCGVRIYACHTGEKLVMPNPCDYPVQGLYTALLCHEIAHVNKWPATHGD
jgi:hypothetical protein